MKRNFAIAVGIFSALFASSVFADPESKATLKNSATERSTPATATSSAEHVVRPGDNLAKIARLHDCRISDLLSSNGLTADSIIHPGQKLKLPAQAQASSAEPSTNPTPPQSAGATHTIAAGETFAAIARQYSIPLNELLAANPEIKPTALRPGQSVSLGQASSTHNRTLDTGSTQMILATKEKSPISDTASVPLASPPTVKIQQIKIDQEMTYLEFATRQGTNTRRLNQLNGLDLLDSALLVKGSELLAPAQP